MSRKFAAFLDAVTEGLNALQPASQREKSRALLLLKLERRNIVRAATKRGELVFHGARGRHAWLMAHHFLIDEPETLEWLETDVQSGQVVWDIGAAIGAFSMYAARGGAKVLAFEPKATSLGLLTEHLAMNGLGDAVSAYGLALSDKTEATRLQLADVAAGGAFNSLEGSQTQFGDKRQAFSQACLAINVDDAIRMFGLPAPDHIKLDVDGIEHRIIAGAAETLRKVQTIIVEVEGENAANAQTLIDEPLRAAGLIEQIPFRERGSKRNRLFRRA